jgi:hypothetical protein
VSPYHRVLIGERIAAAGVTAECWTVALRTAAMSSPCDARKNKPSVTAKVLSDLLLVTCFGPW